jgi:hypothetical protein
MCDDDCEHDQSYLWRFRDVCVATGPRDLVLLILILRLPSTPSSCATMSFILLLHPTLSSSKEPPSRPVSPDDTGNTGVESAPTLQTNFEAFTRFKTQHVTDTLLYHLALDIQREYPWPMAHLLCQSSKPLVPTLTRSFPLIFLFPVPSRPYRQ